MFSYEQHIAKKTCSVLEKYLNESDNILDVGAGTGLVAELILIYVPDNMIFNCTKK